MDLDARTTAWLADDVFPGRRVVRTQPLSGGYRNLNVQLVTDTGEMYVLRRFRHGNTCAVEAALASRVAGAVPVAEVIAADPDGTRTGEPTMVSGFVDGVMLSEVLRSDSDGHHQLGQAVGATLAAIGTITFPRPGFFTGADLIPDGTEPTEALPEFVERCLGKGNADQAFAPDERDALRRYAAHCATALVPLRGSRQLVHSDFNAKNLLVARENGMWAVAAVLDWEFAFAGPALTDVGNMLRLPDETTPAFAAGFVAGFADAGGHLPEDWRQVSQAVDLFALADFLTRPPDHLFFGKAVTLIRDRSAGFGSP